MRKFARIFAVVFISVCLICPMAEALSFDIIQPKLNMTIAPSRDLLIKGTITREAGDPASFDVWIGLYTEGDVLLDERIVQSHVDNTGYTPSTDIYIPYASSKDHVYTYDAHSSITSVDKWMAPDMMYINNSADQFLELLNKAMIYNKHGFDTKTGKYTSGDFFAGIIMGGVTKEYQLNYTDQYGYPLDDIPAGNYKLKIALTGSGGEIVSRTIPITYGYTKGKMLTRYSYVNGHNVKLDAFAKRDPDEYTLLWDYFPGYWDTFEITRRWRPNDSIEYNEGNVHAILYDVHSWNATQNVELAYLAHRGDISSDRVHFYRYDIGEPSVIGSDGTKDGNLVSMDRAKKMELARVEFREGVTTPSDNIYNLDDH
ncbi:MAG: hypothetical protein Q4F74_07465, partial [Synergistaceae bacterium]|nr:hypothetical protein [Synergistaceae bacterium]